jgi:hypothetical protein
LVIFTDLIIQKSHNVSKKARTRSSSL